MLSAEIEEVEERSVDIEYELTISKIETSDMIFEVLMSETVEILNNLEERQF